MRLNNRDSSETIAIVQKDDLEMNKAISSARTSFPQFLNVFKSNCDGCKNFSVKMRFSYGQNKGEHIWLDHLYFEKDKFAGVIANTPENIDWIKFGDTVEVKRDSLSDWMYIKNGKLVGGFTIKVTYNRMSEKEKLQLENDLGVKIR
jgi:uncharacterized protein YegJ (DUF2314 family)